jgi:hypothetical protein
VGQAIEEVNAGHADRAIAAARCRLIPFFSSSISSPTSIESTAASRRCSERRARVLVDDVCARRRNFFLGYARLEIPSNIILAQVGARRWIARGFFPESSVT